MVELMASFESLLRITGGTHWADRAEEVAFNSLPASMTPDLKGLHYLTAANLISCDSGGEQDFQNTGTLVSFDPRSYRCCQHNVAFGWPYFAEHLWLATPITALPPRSTPLRRHGQGRRRRGGRSSKRRYPFEDEVRLSVACERPVAFPLYLRLPGWAKKVRITVNGEAVEGPFRGGRYAVLRRTWRHGDQVRLDLAPEIEAVTWPTVGGAVSIRRGRSGMP
jgi:DUF1680 family protein